MGARANTDLYASLTKIIDELEKTADVNISLTPEMIRWVAATLTTVRNCHVTLAEFEALVNSYEPEASNVVALHGLRVAT